MIVVVDTKLANSGSMLNMLKKAGYKAKLSADHKDLLQASHLILPGVGSFDHGMQSLENSGLINCLHELVIDKKVPVLGVCLGMQLFTKGSEEGDLPGLSWLDAETVKFKLQSPYKLPHIGWNTTFLQNKDCHALFTEVDDETRFYFVHSYYVKCNEPKDIMTTTNYSHEFTSSFKHENIYGVQFHPEKSHVFGLHFFKSFIERTSSVEKTCDSVLVTE